jgi:hypothetical protein
MSQKVVKQRPEEQYLDTQVDEESDVSHLSLCIFLESGRTFTFHGVKILHDNESALTFKYKAMSDGRIKTGSFSKFRIVGHSLY